MRSLCRQVIVVSVAAAALAAPAALTPEVLEPVRSVPPHVAGKFRDVRAFQQSGAGVAVADAPEGQPRIQTFNPAGFRITGFLLPDRARARVATDDMVLSGVASILFTGTSILVSQPEHGALVPTSLFFNAAGRLLVTPGLHEFDPWPAR